MIKVLEIKYMEQKIYQCFVVTLRKEDFFLDKKSYFFRYLFLLGLCTCVCMYVLCVCIVKFIYPKQ